MPLIWQRRESQTSAEMRLRKASTVSHGSEHGILKAPSSTSKSDIRRKSSGATTVNSEKKSGSETEAIEKMLDDINHDVDEIVQVRFSQDEIIPH